MNYMVGQEYPFIVTKPTLNPWPSIPNDGLLPDINGCLLGRHDPAVEDFTIKVMECVEIIEHAGLQEIAQFVDEWGCLWATTTRSESGWDDHCAARPWVFRLEKIGYGDDLIKAYPLQEYVAMLTHQIVSEEGYSLCSAAPKKSLEWMYARDAFIRARLRDEFGILMFGGHRADSDGRYRVSFRRQDGSLAIKDR